MESPFEITIYNKDFEFEGSVVNPGYAYFVPAWRNQGYGNFMLDANNPHTEALQQKGARIVCHYRGEHLISGPVRSRQGDILANGTVTYQVSDDRRLLRNTLAFVQPFKPLEATSLSSTGQTWYKTGSGTAGTTAGQFGYYLWPNGTAATGYVNITSAEQAIKHIIEINLVTRLGRPVVIEPNLGRGGDIAAAGALPDVRFETLEEIVEKILDWSGLGIRLWQPLGEAAIHVDVFESGVWEQELTPESGIVRFGTYSVDAPEITRAIVGGPGDGIARAFSGLQGPGLKTDREEDYNDVIEVFRDGTSATLNWPSALADNYRVAKYYPFQVSTAEANLFSAFMAAAAQAGLDAGAPTSGLALTLAETETFHFGGPDGIQIGDEVTIRSNGIPFTDRLTQAEISWTRDDGLKVTPIVGEKADDPDEKFASAIVSLATALRNLSTAK